MKRVLVTGIGGFVGTQLAAALERHGCEVLGIDQSSGGNPNVVRANLLDPEETKSAFRKVGDIDAVVHLAALSTGTKPPLGYTLETVNAAILQNTLDAIDNVGQFVYFSSTTVYGEENRNGFVRPQDELRPASPYGIGKKRCEEMVLARNFPSTAICRPTPVYTEDRMRNMQVRALFPFTNIKIHIVPNPSYSLCHLDIIIKTVAAIIERCTPGVSIRNLADAVPHRQREIAARFPGFAWPVPTLLFWPFYMALKAIPGRRSYQLRCLYRKLFCSCLYDTQAVEYPG